MPQIGMIFTYESGVDIIVEWKINDFFTLSERDGAGCSSPRFSFGGERWFLWIRPNGSSENDSSGHVDLELWKNLSNRSIEQSFSLSFKTARGEKYNEQHFDNGNCFHEFNRFIQRSELSRRRSDLVPDGTLTIICTMKSTTSAGSDRTGSANESARSHGNPMQGKSFENNEMGMRNLIRTLIGLTLPCKCLHSAGAGSLCEDYKKVLLDGRHHDLILKVGDKELRAHRDILRVRSRVFQSMLDHDMKEKNKGVIDLPDCDPNAMELFLSYVYCGKIEALDHGNMLGLYYVADKYEMMELKSECCNFIKKSLSLSNICSVIQLALNHSDSDLLEYATGYFSDNVLDILQTVEWQSFLKDNSTIGNELLIKSVKKLKNAQT